MTQDYEMIAARVGAVFQPLIDAMRECCKRSPQLVEDSLPCGAFPFLVKRSVPQTSECHVAVNAFSVPEGHDGFLKTVSFTERYPGTLYGAHYFLLINGAIHPWFNRLDMTIGTGFEQPLRTHVCLKEGDVISVMVQCSWVPWVFPGQEDYIQTIFPFALGGYFYPKEYFETDNILEL